MFTRIPAGFPPRPTAPVPSAPPLPMSPPSQIPNRAQTRHTRHARVGLTPISSTICAQFPSHTGVGVSRLSPARRRGLLACPELVEALLATIQPPTQQLPTPISSTGYRQSPSPRGVGGPCASPFSKFYFTPVRPGPICQPAPAGVAVMSQSAIASRACFQNRRVLREAVILCS